MSDPVDFYDLDQELDKLRQAIALIANRLGQDIGMDTGRELTKLLKRRYES